MKIGDAIKQKKFSSGFQKLILNLLYTHDWIKEPINSIFKDHNVTIAQFNILRILKGSSPKPLSPAEVKSVMLNKKSDLTRLFDRLASKNLIDRKICPSNRRKMDITITKDGLSLLKKLTPLVKSATDDRIAEHITEEEAIIASDIIDKLRGQG